MFIIGISLMVLGAGVALIGSGPSISKREIFGQIITAIGVVMVVLEVMNW